MELNKNSFPINLTREEALNLIESNFSKKGYSIKLNKDKIYMTIVPYWFCFYDIHIDSKENGFETISGQTALNALTNKIEADFIKLFESSNPRVIDKIKLPGIEKIKIKVKKQVVNEAESKITINKLLRAKYNVSENNISLSGFVEIWIPFWKTYVEDVEYKLDSTTGKFNNFEKIKTREKTDSELFYEMLDDIKNPQKLLTYVGGFFKGFFNLFKVLFSFIYKYKVLFLIMLIIILFILFFL